MHRKTLIIRHKKENKKKCTLEPLKYKDEFQFYTYPGKFELPDLKPYVLLSIEAEKPLSMSDADKGIILLDGTWKYAQNMSKALFTNQPIVLRTLPKNFKTAYPRKQTHCLDPERGLASIEALYIAYRELGWCTKGLLDHYYFGENFLALNQLEDIEK
ncbi:MAG: hypothetical protein S4CHLAM7_09010 [Chlamydiae bacterium]|nr:hypothetical protein [Chlamydiota bacterium]